MTITTSFAVKRSNRFSSRVFNASNPPLRNPHGWPSVLNATGVRFVIASFPLTDGARLSRDVKTIIAWSVDGRIQNYSGGGHHDPNQRYTTKQRAGRCNSSA